MKRRSALVFVLPLVLTACLVGICLWLQQHEAPARDGYGPDPSPLAMVFCAWTLGLLLALTTLGALVSKARMPSDRSRRLRGSAFHLALWLTVGATLAAPWVQQRLWLYSLNQSPEWKAPHTVARGTLEEVERAYQQARRDADDPALLNDAMKSAALEHLRVDVLGFLKSQGVAFAEAGREGAWVASIIDVLRSGDSQSSQATLDTVRWLMQEGAPLGFSLKAAAADFSSVDFYFTVYDDIEAPATRQLLDLLVAHGADTVGCKNQAPCPIVYLAAKGKTAAVRYLLAQGADPDSVGRDGDETALSAAILGQRPGTVKLLLQAGARPRFGDRQNDIVSACDSGSGSDAEARAAVIETLRKAGVRLRAEDLARYQGTLHGDDQRACIERFM